MPTRAQVLLPIYEHRLLHTHTRIIPDIYNLFPGSNMHHVGSVMGSINLSICTSLITHLLRLDGYSRAVPLDVRQKQRIQYHHLFRSGSPPMHKHFAVGFPYPWNGKCCCRCPLANAPACHAEPSPSFGSEVVSTPSSDDGGSWIIITVVTGSQ